MRVRKDVSPAALSFVEGLDASDGTKVAYRAALSKFESFKLPMDSNVLAEFNARLKRQQFAPATRQLYLSALRRYIAHLITGGQEVDIVTAEAKLKNKRGKTRDGYKHKQAPEGLPGVVNYFDVEPAIPDGKWAAHLRLEWLRNRALMHTLYSSAGRISEVLSLTRKDVAGGRAVEVLVTGKGNKQRMLFLTPDAQATIRAYCDARNDDSPALFISHRRGKGQTLTRESAWRIIKSAGNACNVPNISPHMFRHYRATQLINEGMPLESVQAYLGHTSPETTRIVYAHSNTRIIREQLAEYGLSARDAAKKP